MGGISPRVIYGGLATALMLFLAVIFVLPALVTREVPADNNLSPNVDESASLPFPAETPAIETGSGPVVLTPGDSGEQLRSFACHPSVAMLCLRLVFPCIRQGSGRPASGWLRQHGQHHDECRKESNCSEAAHGTGLGD